MRERLGAKGEEEGCALCEAPPLALPLGVELPDALPLRLNDVEVEKMGEREPVAVGAGEPVGAPALPLAGVEALDEKDAMPLCALEGDTEGDPLCVRQPDGERGGVCVLLGAPLGLARGEEEGRAEGLSGPLRDAEGVAPGEPDDEYEGGAVREGWPSSRMQ